MGTVDKGDAVFTDIDQVLADKIVERSGVNSGSVAEEINTEEEQKKTLPEKEKKDTTISKKPLLVIGLLLVSLFLIGSMLKSRHPRC
ncbi:hypothetical protein CHISP_2717 [Chitinispirillum alkaliphilum]|nr:hypothetical protein CHISP_2717 [Chitinispirillum alkaliphilum]